MELVQACGSASRNTDVQLRPIMREFIAATLLMTIVFRPVMAATLSPASVDRAIAANGAKTVVDRLAKSGEWEIVIDQIKAGSAAWIKLVPALADGTDAGTSEELLNGLVYALPKAPKSVLAVVDMSGRSGARSLQDVCNASFYEGDPTNPAQYRIVAIRNVSRENEPSLYRARHACLLQLQKTH